MSFLYVFPIWDRDFRPALLVRPQVAILIQLDISGYCWRAAPPLRPVVVDRIVLWCPMAHGPVFGAFWGPGYLKFPMILHLQFWPSKIVALRTLHRISYGDILGRGSVWLSTCCRAPFWYQPTFSQPKEMRPVRLEMAEMPMCCSVMWRCVVHNHFLELP